MNKCLIGGGLASVPDTSHSGAASSFANAAEDSGAEPLQEINRDKQIAAVKRRSRETLDMVRPSEKFD